MFSGLFVCPLVLAVVVVFTAVAYPQGVDNLLPNWMDGNKNENPVTESTPRSSSGCTASLDFQTNGNPNCPQDKQYFDIDSCQFLCPATPTPILPVQTSQKNSLP